MKEKLLDGFNLANRMNVHCLTAGTPNEPYDDSLDPVSFMTGMYSKSLFLLPCSQNEIFNIIHSLKLKCAPGVDNIMTRPVKQIADIIACPLAHICNAMLTSGSFPDNMKLARVRVIYKGGNRNYLNNYVIIISVLSVFAKVAKHVINNCLYSFIFLITFL